MIGDMKRLYELASVEAEQFRARLVALETARREELSQLRARLAAVEAERDGLVVRVAELGPRWVCTCGDGREPRRCFEHPEKYWSRVETSVEELLEERDAARAEVERLKVENMCDACAGTGKPASGKPCMCGGTGKMSCAALLLRKTLVDVTPERIAEAISMAARFGGFPSDLMTAHLHNLARGNLLPGGPSERELRAWLADVIREAMGRGT